MVDLAEYSAGPLVTSVMEYYENREAKEAARGYLGASGIGHPCNRFLWYGFRWAAKEAFDGQKLRLFDTGHRAEDRFVFELRQIGVEVYDRNPDDGKQFGFKDVGGHVSGHMDGCAHKVPMGGDKWHVCEFKTHNDKSFKELLSKGVKVSKPSHYDQMTLYMGWSTMDRTLYIAENKNDSALYSERVEFDPVHFEKLRARAGAIVGSNEPPPRISDDPTSYLCRSYGRLCPAHDVCHGSKVPAISCRTCCYSTPEMDGDARWSCNHPTQPHPEIPIEVQRTGCNEHLVLPFLVTYADVVDSGPSGWILFKRRDSGRHFVVASASAMPPADMFAAYDSPALYHSAELSAAHDHRIIGNDSAERLRAEFDGRIVG